MMRQPLLFVDHAPALGGAERSLLLLLANLDKTRWELHLAGVAGPLLDEAARLGVPTHIVPLSRLRRSATAPVAYGRGVHALRQVENSIAAAAIYANTVRAAVYAAPAARLGRRPFIWHMRDFWLSEGVPSNPQVDTVGKRSLCATAAAIIVNSHAVAAHLPASGRLHVIHNGIAVTQFDPTLSGHPFRQQHAIPADAPLAMMVGRLRPWKGQGHFLHMATAVLDTVPTAHFAIVGGTPFGDPDGFAFLLREEAQGLGLAGKVHFTGQLDDVRPALAAADVFVHPGNPEPFGLVNVEAMAMALPVVAFAHGALPEIVTDGDTGLLVTPGQTASLAQAVAALLAAPERAKTLGHAGRKRVESDFTSDRVAADVDAVLQKVVA